MKHHPTEIYGRNGLTAVTFKQLSLWVVVVFAAATLNSPAQESPAGIRTSTENVLWLRSDQGTSTDINGEAVGEWLNISGYDNHASQTEAGEMPEYVTAGINGHPSLRFDGSNFLVVEYNNSLDITSGLTILAVVQPDGIDELARGLVSKRISPTSGQSYSLFTHTDSDLFFDTPNSSNRHSGSAVTNDPQILSGVYNGNDPNPRSRIYQQGVETGSGNAPTSIGSTASDLHIGILNSGYGQGFEGDMSEVIIYRSALNRAERLIVEAYLANRYNIPLAATGYSSTTHNQGFTGIGHADGDKYSATANIGSGILLAESNNSLDEDNEFVFTGHDGTPHDIDNSDLPTVAGVELDDRWARIYYIERVQDGTPNAGTTDIRIGFDFDGTGITPSSDRAYYLLYRPGTSGAFSVVTGGTGAVSDGTAWFSINSDNFASGYYTIAKTDLEIGTYYSYEDGDWDDTDTWSFDPNLPVEVGSPPGEMDRVVIQGSKTVTVTQDNTTAGILEVNAGILDFGTTTGSSFATIGGQPSGTIRLAADNFPSGDASGFADAATGGTVEYYGNGYELNTTRTFRDMRINLDGADDQLVLLANYTLNGSLTIERGELHFGNSTSTTGRTVTVREAMETGINGKIRTGTGNARHRLNLYGDFLNRGNVQFTNRTEPGFTTEADNGIVDVRFLSPLRDQQMLLEGPSRFYRVEINKQTSTYELNMEASEDGYFNLFGYANQTHGDVAQLTTNQNAFGLISGTVRVGPNINIERLNIGNTGNYNISENAVLHVDGGEVTKPTGTAIVVYGRIIVSAGTLNADINSGITTRLNGVFESRGGTTNLRQFRTSVFGAQHQGGYIQSGGTVNLVDGSINESYPRFCLTYTGNLFVMSGGTLHIQRPGDKGGLYINSDPENVSVTGGNVIFGISDNRDFVFTSKAPFWNLEMRKTVANSNSFIINDIDDVGGTSLAGQPLRVLRDLRISGTESGYEGVDFYPVTDEDNVNDVYIGGSFFIESGSQYWTAADGNRENDYNGTNHLPTIMNTTWFNQTAGTPDIAYLYWGNWQVLDYGSGPMNSANMAEFGNVVLNRDPGNELRVNSPGPGSGLRGNSALTIDINGNLTVESGTLCQGRLTIRTWGSVTNNDRLGTWYPEGPYPTASGTPNAAQIRFRESEDGAPVINSTAGAVFGNTRFNVAINSPFLFQNHMYFERLEYMQGILYLGQYNLKVDDMWNLNNDNNVQTNFFTEGAGVSSYLRVADKGRASAGDANQRIMIITRGRASDGGLSLKVSQNTTDNPGNDVRNNLSVLTFPIGFSTDNFATGLTNTYYRPAQVKVTDFSDDGYLTIRPVSEPLHTSDPAGGEILQHYWRVTQSEFTDLPTLAYRFYYRNRQESGIADLPDGAANENLYVPGKVLDESPYTRSYESDDPAEQDTDGVYSSPDADTRVIVFNGNNTGTTDDDLFGFSDDAPGIEAENANYSAGQYERFIGAPSIYYNVRGGGWDGRNWGATGSWTTDPDLTINPATVPGAGDIVVIRGVNGETGINVNGTREAAEIIMIREGVYNDIEDLQRLRFQPADQLTVSRISGVGELYLIQNLASGPTINADIGDFARNDTSLVQFYMNGADGVYSRDETEFFTELPTLRIYGNNNPARVASFTYDLNFKNLIVDGRGGLYIGGNYTVENRTRLGFTGGGRIIFPNGDEPFRLKTGEFVTGRGKSQQDNFFELTVEEGGDNGIEHIFEVERNIDLHFADAFDQGTCNIDLFTTPDDNNVILRLSGAGNHAFNDNYSPGNSTIELYKIELDKGTDASSSFTLNNAFTLNGPTSGAGIPKAVTLHSGTLVINHEDIDIDLTTGNDSFVIPATSGLVVSAGQVNVSGANSGILLDGLLRADGNGIINMDGGPGVNNFIEYSASGNATIEVEDDGQLIVGSQIRRGTTNPSGILRYTQTGGSVTVGLNAAPVSNRGVFEIVNTGSSFTHTGGSLTIVRPQSAPTRATILLEPSVSNVGNTTLHIGNAGTPPGSIFTLKSSIALGNLNVDGSSVARLKDRSLVINRDLAIEAGSSFDGTGSFSLTVNRHIDNQGAASLNVDTLFLRGTATFPSEAEQNISGNLTVNHLVVEPDASVTLQAGSNMEVTGDLYINSGQLIDGGNTITLKGNVTNNASHISSDPGDGGLLFSGTALQRIYGTGQFGRLEIDNTQKVQLENSIHLTQDLTLTNGIFHIQHHRLSLGQAANVITSHPDGFNAGRMIAVYGGDFVPQGLRKYIPTVAGGEPADAYNPDDPAYTWSFTWPIGTDDGTEQKYLPMDLHVATNATAGHISLVPVDHLHMTFADPGQDENILHQYWRINSSGLSDFTALHLNHYTQDAVNGNEEDYIGARLFEGFWTKYFESDDPPIEVVYEDENYIAFIHTGVDEISGDYTAGDPGYIPDEVPTYFSRQDGDWTHASTWERSDGGVVAAGGPVGQNVHIRTAHTVTISNNFRRAYQTRINGTLELGSTIRHILGYVRGTGTLTTLTSSVPAGNYDEFFGCGGGTMQYGGTGNYTLNNLYTHYNNLTITGSGNKTLPDQHITICGDLRIEEEVTFTTRANRNIDLFGNLYKSGPATWFAELSQQTLQLQSPTSQSVTGTFTGTGNRFNNLYIYEDKDVVLNGPVHVRTYLGLYGGSRLFSTRDNLITLNRSTDNIQDVHANSYVDGPLQSNIAHGTAAYNFPVGRGGNKKVTTLLNVNHTSGSRYWQAEYNNTSAGSEGRDPSQAETGINTVSTSEYWVIAGPVGGSARIRFTLTGTSEIAGAVSDPDDLRIVMWNEAEDQWEIAGTGSVRSGTVTDGTITTQNTVSFDGSAAYFTLASVAAPVLPTAQITSGDAEICEGELPPIYQLVIELTGNDPWEIDYNDGTGNNFTVTGINSSPHTIDISTLDPGNYTFSLDAVRDNVGNPGTVFGQPANVSVYFEPESFELTSGGDICGPTTTTIDLDESEIGVTYRLYRNASYTGVSLAGTGSSISFTGIDQGGTYTVRGINDEHADCYNWMNGNPEITIGSAGTAEIIELLSDTPVCEGDPVEIRIRFEGIPPFTFTLADNHEGSWTVIEIDTEDLTGVEPGPYTYDFTIPDSPQWNPPDLPNVYTYTITYIEDDAGCGPGTTLGPALDIEVYKIPETGPQYHIPNTFGE